MSILNLEHINRSIGERTILSDVNASMDASDRIGVVGINGAGKSTLLAIAAHIVFNLAGALTGLWVNLWITEIILLVLGIAGLVYVIKQRKNGSFPEPARRLKQY